jgi:23S rRNA pseudouridine1911/1915/1917 synthase
VLGDPVYGRGAIRLPQHAVLERYLRAFPRQALHAEHLRFQHPEQAQWVEFTAPVPEDMADLMARLDAEVGL